MGGFRLPIRWDYRFSTGGDDFIAKLCRIIATVGNHKLKGQANNQLVSLQDIVPLAGSQPDPQRIPQSIGGKVDFGAEPTPAATQRLFSLTTVFCGPRRAGVGADNGAVNQPVF